MGAVGPNHFVELLNGKIVVYRKAGVVETNGGPLEASEFFRLSVGVIHFPQGEVADPRIVYDRLRNRWIASVVDGGSKDVLLAVSINEQPTPLTSNWKKYRVHFKRGSDLTDFPTLGGDANGIYLSVQYFLNGSNAVVAINKSQLYDHDDYQAWSFDTESTSPRLRIIQPPVSFDTSAPGNYAWMVAKDPPDVSGGTYQAGGPIVYRRLQWVSGVPQLVDTQWLAVAESTPTYRDYFDLDVGDPQNGAPQRGGPIKIRVDGSISGGVGSRLSMAVIRGGVLWTCHHIGLDGADSQYNGGAVDRSAVQWIRLQIDNNGLLVAQNNASHGRICDPCGLKPFWYYYPSVMVNAAGDILLGFSGSSEGSFISAFYFWRLADGTEPARPILIKQGEDYFPYDRCGDYSCTSLDPIDNLTFWTVQEYSKPPQEFQWEWGTSISGITLP